MATKARRTRTVLLPWEGRNAWLRALFSARRWRLLLGATLAGLVVFFIYRVSDRHERTRATRAAIAEVKRAVGAFRQDVGRCPRSTVELVHPPRSGAHYLAELPSDGWGRPLWVRCPGRLDPGEVDVVSAGPTGSFYSDENIQ